MSEPRRLFVAGLVGRSASFRRAGEARDIQTAGSLLHLSDWFELTLVIPSYLAPRRKRRAQTLSNALAQGKVTPELVAALHDRGVLLFRRAEFLVTGVVTVLMILKPNDL